MDRTRRSLSRPISDSHSRQLPELLPARHPAPRSFRAVRFLNSHTVSHDGADMATQTTTTSPPSWQVPYLQYGLGQAKSIYDSGGAPVIPFSPQSEQALQGVIDRSTAGSP